MAVLSTFRKEEKKCAICSNPVKEEFMMTGGLRQVSIKMTDELRTLYKDFQEQPVVPFMYEVITCPKCSFTALLDDFTNIIIDKTLVTEAKKTAAKQKRIEILKQKSERDALMESISNVNFGELKNRETALASYILAEKCYDYFDDKFFPEIKKGICSIRAAWLASDLGLKNIEDKYYQKAKEYYASFTSKPDATAGQFKFGPDWGNNFGFDGARYLNCVLEIKFLDKENDPGKQFTILQDVRSTLSRLRGFGKASKEKVGPLIKLTEDMFEKIQPFYEKLKEQVESGEIEAKPIQEKIIKEEAPTALKQEDKVEEKQLDKYHQAAIEIVKYGIRSGLKKDSTNDIVKILKKHFSD